MKRVPFHPFYHRGPLDEDLFTSLSVEPEAAAPAELEAEPAGAAADAPAAAAAPAAEEPEALHEVPALAAADRPPRSTDDGAPASPDAAPAAPAAQPPPAPPALEEPPLAAPPMQPLAAETAAPGAGAPAGRRKKVIRSRIGYARGAAAADAGSLAAALAGAGPAPPVAAAPAAGAPAPPSPVQQLSAAGSMQSEGGGSYSPAAAAFSRPSSQAASDAGHDSRRSSPGPQEVEVQPAGRRSAGGDDQHLTALQQHVAQLDIRLELPSRRSTDLSGGAGAAADGRGRDHRPTTSGGSTGGCGWAGTCGACSICCICNPLLPSSCPRQMPRALTVLPPNLPSRSCAPRPVGQPGLLGQRRVHHQPRVPPQR